MRTRLILIIGIFLMIFSIDGILLSDSALPECVGFTGMGWFVLISTSLDPRISADPMMAILSDHECIPTFYIQTGSGILFVVGLALIVHLMIKRKKNRLNGDLIRR